jgi:SPP1 gp7 family putative phage head morphogenesis protein
MTRPPRDNALTMKIGLLLASHMAAANILGRHQVVKTVQQKTGKRVPLSTSSRKALFADDASAGYSLNVPSEGAIAYLRGLTPVTKETFDGLSAQYKRDAFTVAGTSDLRLIAKIRDALAQVAADGGTAGDFEAAVHRLTSEAGVADLNAFTLDTAFQTSLQKAYSLGRYEQMIEPSTQAVLPYWQYWTVGDDRVRPEHAAFHLFTARAEDPVWRKLYPPNGFNCRCSVVPILPEEAPEDANESGILRASSARYLLSYLKIQQSGLGKVFAI